MDKETPTEIEARLRRELGVPENASLGDVYQLIRDRGGDPRPGSTIVSGETLFACPVVTGIFISREQQPDTGQLANEGHPTAIIAALQGLRIAQELHPDQV